MLEEMDIYHEDLTDAQIVSIALDIMRILCEIPYGKSEDQESELFFNAYKSDTKLLMLIRMLYVDSAAKNTLLNEIMKKSKGKDLEKLIKELRK